MDSGGGQKCKYRAKYFDYEKGIVSYHCPRPAVTDKGFCEFHDPDYWREHKAEVRHKFERIVERALKEKEKLLCIGFHLPSVTVKGQFEKPVYFSGAKFHERAVFSDAEFHERADFSDAKFSSEALFVHTRLIFSTEDYDQDRDVLDGNCVSFRYAEFLKPSRVAFDNVYLGRVSFVNCNIERVNFRNVVWRERGNRYVAFDEELLAAKAKRELGGGLEEKYSHLLEDITLVDVLGVYRRLRENYDYNLRYVESGKFFISEMEVRRQYREVSVRARRGLSKIIERKCVYNSWLRRNISITNLYRVLCNYGEDHIKPLLWSLLTIVGFALLRLLLSCPNVRETTTSVSPSKVLSAFSSALEESVRAFFQMGGTTGVDLVERLLAALVFGVLMISLRRKFERRFRH